MSAGAPKRKVIVVAYFESPVKRNIFEFGSRRYGFHSSLFLPFDFSWSKAADPTITMVPSTDVLMMMADDGELQ